MILTHKTGVLLHGTLAKDPVFKDVGQKQVLKFDVKAHSVKTDTGSWESLYVQVNVWHGLDKWDGMLLKGDAVTVLPGNSRPGNTTARPITVWMPTTFSPADWCSSGGCRISLTSVPNLLHRPNRPAFPAGRYTPARN